MRSVGRSLFAARGGVRGLSWMVTALSVTGALLAATSASAAGTDWIAQNVSPTSSDSSSAVVPVAPATTTRIPQEKHSKWALHLHGGLFAPIEVNSTSPTIGLRLSRFVSPHLQAGLLTGWTLRRKNLEQPVDGLPGLKPSLVLARAEGELLPVMAFFQVNVTDTRYLVPYA